MAITHIVMFQFKKDVTPEVVKETCSRMLNLKNTCLNPSTKRAYIKSVIGGVDNSPEGIQKGITHAFVVEFENAGDRDYYVREDPAHLAFVKTLGGLIDKAQAVDFTNAGDLGFMAIKIK